MIGVNHYLILSGILFSIGLVGVLRRKNLLCYFWQEICLMVVFLAFCPGYLGGISYWGEPYSWGPRICFLGLFFVN